MKSIIHIGMDKTGTTYIQQVLSEFQDQLNKIGINCPIDKQRDEISNVDFARELGFGWNDVATDASALEAGSRLKIGDGQTLLLSSEAFSASGDPAIISRLQSWLKLRGIEDVQIVIYIRNQIDFYTGIYSESIKWGEKRSITDFYDVSRDRLFYESLIYGWESVFGRGAVVVKSYDHHKADLMRSFLDLIEVPDQLKQAMLDYQVAFPNNSPSQILMESVRIDCQNMDRDDLYDYVFREIISKSHCNFKAMAGFDVWKLPPGLMDDLAALDDMNRRLSAEFSFPTLPQLSKIAGSYGAKVLAMPDDTIRRWAGFLMKDLQ